jgi:hypothetical protein
MNRKPFVALLVGCLGLWTFVAKSQEAPATTSPPDSAENAALRYWQAYAAMSRALTPETKKRVDDHGSAPIDDVTADAIARCENALRLVRSGAKLPYCSWGLDLEAGPRPRLEDFDHVRGLTRLTNLSARQHFENGRNEQGIEDVFALIALARHVGIVDLAQYRGVQSAIELEATDTLGRYLPKLNPVELAAVQSRLKALPPVEGLKETVLLERRLFPRWVETEAKNLKNEAEMRAFIMRLDLEDIEGICKAAEGNPERLLEMIAGTRKYMDEMIDLIDRSSDDFSSELVRFEFRMSVENRFAGQYFAMYDGFFSTQASRAVKYAMLQAASTLLIDGPQAFHNVKDPYGDGPFEYRKMEPGFELRSKLSEWSRLGIGRKTWQE